ncbi:hypothetical protein ACFL6Y_07505 [Elusimicrobiota bacterium]
MDNIMLGAVLIIVGLFGVTFWWWDVWLLLKGLLPLVILALGIVALIAGLGSAKEKEKSKVKATAK